eukprot:COSAG01_NODE_14009_length_1507_cov_42.685369_1_plen_75_part_00
MLQAKDACKCGSGIKTSMCCKTVEDGLLWNYYHPVYECPRCPWCMLLPAMQTLLKISNHLALLRPRQSDSQGAF